MAVVLTIRPRRPRHQLTPELVPPLSRQLALNARVDSNIPGEQTQNTPLSPQLPPRTPLSAVGAEVESVDASVTYSDLLAITRRKIDMQ